MENRTYNARIQCRTKEKEKEVFYELCKKNKTSVIIISKALLTILQSCITKPPNTVLFHYIPKIF